jgi:hypothetical protein
MGHKSPSDWVSGFQTGFWLFPRLRNRRKLNCKITDDCEITFICISAVVVTLFLDVLRYVLEDEVESCAERFGPLGNFESTCRLAVLQFGSSRTIAPNLSVLISSLWQEVHVLLPGDTIF